MSYAWRKTIVAMLVLAVCSAVACEDDTTQDGDPVTTLAPDATRVGPLATTFSEYHFAPGSDDEILSTAQTELWARVYRPTQLTSAHPVLMFLHGNHFTCASDLADESTSSCAYTFTGHCSEDQQVVPNHLGYAYLAERLASWGYVVVSINANLGITCGDGVSGDDGLVLARGRLVLRHLEMLSQWSNQGGTPAELGVDLQGKLDLSQVGLMGHSRGGEGMRAAHELYREAGSPWPTRVPGLQIRGVFEIAPTDGASARALQTPGTAWATLLGSCDGDVMDLSGMRPYDRVLVQGGESPARPKALVMVHGANHNFYNTIWQVNDSEGCLGSSALWSDAATESEDQRATALATVMPFFRAYVGTDADPKYALSFDPRTRLPGDYWDITRYERAFAAAAVATGPVLRVESFESDSRFEAGEGAWISLDDVPEHSNLLKAGFVHWDQVDSSLQNNWDTAVDLTDRATLDLRVGVIPNHELNKLSSTTSWSIRLVDADGDLGPAVSLSSYVQLREPVGAQPDLPHVPLRSVRIPLAHLGGLAKARGVRFEFDETAQGAVVVADITLTRAGADPWPLGDVPQIEPQAFDDSFDDSVEGATGQAQSALARVTTPARLARVARRATGVEIEVVPSDGSVFPVRDALPVLSVDGKRVAVGRFGPDGDLRRMVFEIPAAEVALLPSRFGARVTHREDTRSGGRAWDLGELNKADVDR